MPKYLATVTSSDGAATNLEIDAVSVIAVHEALGSAGYLVLTVVELEAFDVIDQPGHGFGTGQLSSQQAHDLAHHLAGLAQAGLPIPDGLRALRDELPAGSLGSLAGELADRMDRGEPLDSALEQLGSRFPRHLRGLILAGARSGRIVKLLGEFVGYSQVGASLRRAVWLSLAYPLMMIGIYGAIFCFLSLVVIQRFEMIFADFGVSLPWVTIVLLKASHAVTEAGWATVAAPILAIGAVTLGARVLLEPTARYRLVSWLPVYGPLSRWTSLAEFSHYLGLFLECDVPLPTAIPLAAEGTAGAALVELSHAVAEDVRTGAPLADALAGRRLVPYGFMNLLRWGEENHALPETLHMTAQMLEARAKAHASFLKLVSTVVSVVIILWGSAFVALALFWPLITLLGKLM